MNSRSIYRGLVLIGIGVLLLLANFGYVEWGFWWNMARLWPLLLIALGIRLMFRDSVLAAVLAAALVLGTFGYAAWQTQGMDGGERSDRQTARFEQAADAALESCRLDVDFGAGELYVGAGTAALAEGELDYYGIPPEWRYSSEGAQGRLQASQAQNAVEGFFRQPNHSGYHWDIKLSEQPLWDIDADTGACEADFDLTGLPVSRFDLDTGASSVEIRLGDRQPACQVRINAGASNISLAFPAGAGVRVGLDGALNGNNLAAAGLVRQGDYYVTAGYADAAVRFDVDIDMGVGNLDVAFR